MSFVNEIIMFLFDIGYSKKANFANSIFLNVLLAHDRFSETR